MNRAKLTPCRKVGLSRKTYTPNRTIDSLLTESTFSPTTPNSVKLKQKVNAPSSSSQHIELDYDTPCRQVGLSRKRKTRTPLTDVKSNISVPTTPSLPRVLVDVKLKKRMLKDVTDNKDQNETGCAIRLTEKFSSTSNHNSPQIMHSEGIKEVSISKSEVSNLSTSESSVEQFVGLDDKKEVIFGESIEKYQLCKQENFSDVKDFDFSDKGENTFIKVCYEDKKINSIKKPKNKNSPLSNKPKYHRKIFDDNDDDFEVSTKRIKSKNKFGRYETDVAALQKKVLKKESIPLKKSLSLGDKDHNNSSLRGGVSKNSITDCYVKLVQMKNKISPKVQTSQELSDDDFEMFASTPPDIRSKINDLEKQVKEKRNILEELERAKVYKKMHDIEELKSLASTWENGCKQALSDLLEKLNTHTEINMNMLLRKLNIPEDFMPSSQ